MTKFLKGYFEDVLDAGVRDLRCEFVLWDTPRPLPDEFDYVVQNPRWMAQLEELLAQNHAKSVGADKDGKISRRQPPRCKQVYLLNLV